jgi:hypothetical protein
VVHIKLPVLLAVRVEAAVIVARAAPAQQAKVTPAAPVLFLLPGILVAAVAAQTR